MTKHYSRSHPRFKQELERQKQAQQRKDRGWYCKEHDTKYLCDICGHDSSVHKQRDRKYYFVSG